MKTFMQKKEEVNREWYVIDATDQVLGRLATKAADILRGKNKPEYTPHVDTGDNLIIINSDKIKLTGNKPQKKVYSHHTHHPGGLKTESFAHAMQIHPERVLEHAIKGMLPHNSLGNSQFKKLHVYAGAEHKHLAQKPKELTL